MLKPKILIDTSFILPTLGFMVEREIIEAIKYFRFFEIYYSELSLLEASWKIVRLGLSGKMEIILKGVRAVKETYSRIEIPCKAYALAYKMWLEGHKDMIDNLLYSTAYFLNMRFLTVDDKLISFLRSTDYPVDNVIILPEELKAIASKM
ncbi:MAG: hypothetical protein DRO23_08535 [Thermoprotei archaeon]|nr:MAG: hypothetical protein DRO23_08535 [Thermoprotei archaeon]